jgi:polar amino acid transport system permease protein
VDKVSTKPDANHRKPLQGAALGRKLLRVLNSVPASVLLYALIMGLVIWVAFNGAAAMGYKWQWYRVPKYLFSYTENGFFLGEIPWGLLATLALSGTAFILAVPLGLLITLLRQSDLIIGRAVANVFLEVVRNTPLLVQLYLFYYVLGPIFGFDRYVAGIACLAVFHAALMSEIFRAAINAVPAGQWEAADSIGFSRAQSYRYIILPQTIRFMLPPMTGEIVNMIKSTAIVSVIAVAELATVGRNIISKSFLSFEIWFTIAAVYMAVTLTISIFASYLEKRYAVQD